MSVLEKFAAHFITTWPEVSLWLTLGIFVVLFLISPFLVYLIFSERYNKGRYIFERKNIALMGGSSNSEALYMLDTMKGKLYQIDGSARYKRMHEFDWKENGIEYISKFLNGSLDRQLEMQDRIKLLNEREQIDQLSDAN